LNADPRVNEFLPGPLTREQSNEMAERIDAGFDQRGFGLWAVEITNVAPFIGFIGLSVPRFEAHFTPCVEIGWRLSAEHWRRGYATEGAAAALTFGFDVVGLPELVSFTVPANLRSRRVMEKIGMKHDPADNFEHPSLSEGHPLQHHVLYRLASPMTL
jgi:RimJ/RimL family protein N-acetyltransferase